MAVLGFQLATTLIAASILSKIVSFYSFTRFLYNGLFRLVVPSDQQLLEALGNHKTKSKGKKRRADSSAGGAGFGNGDTSSVFYFPRSMSIQLKSSKVSATDATVLPLYSNLQWLLDFTVCTLGVYFVSEIAQGCFGSWFDGNPRNITSAGQPLSQVISLNTRINLSLVWLSLTVWFAVRTLISMTGIYFRSSAANDGQKSESRPTGSSSSSTGTNTSSSADCMLVVAAGFCFLVAAVFFLSLDDRYFDFGLRLAYGNLTVQNTDFTTAPIISRGAFQSILALISAFIGALFVYPGLKFGKVYLDSVNKHINSAGKRILLHLSFFSPLIPLLLWIPPLTDHISRSLTVLMHSTFVAKNPIWLVGTTTALELFTVHLATIHLLSCVLVVLLRIGTVRWNLQTYLSAAQDKLDRFSREPGRTSNREVQRLVASVFYCLNLVALQLVAPTILLLALVCLLKSVAGIAWLPTHCVKNDSVSVSTDPLNAYNYSLPSILDSSSSQYSWSATIIQARFAFTQITSNLGARGSVVARGVLRFLVWWCLFALQAVNLLGFAYHRFTADE